MNSKELASAEHSYRATLLRVSDAVVALDTNWHYTFLNDTALANHPLGREETLGKTIWEIHPDLIGTIFEEKYRHSMATGTVNEAESYYPPMDIWFSVKIYPDKDGLTIIYKDITAAKKTEEQIKANQQRLQLIYDTVSDPLFLIDVLSDDKYLLVSVNQAFFTATGFTHQQIINKYINDILPQSSRQMVLGNYKQVVQTKKMMEWEEVGQFPTGTKIGIVCMSPILDKEGNCVQLLGVIHDITERKKAELSIIEMNKQLRNLSAHLQTIREEERTKVAREIHDDLGQQLTGIKFVLTALKNKNNKEFQLAPVDESVREMIDMVDATIVSVRRIAKDLRPGVLDDLGLEAAIDWQAREFEERTGIKTTFTSELNNQNFSKEINTAVFRIAQESLTNITRHAQATAVHIKMGIEANSIILNITDNGVGI
ncbi:MAG TPA: PAS domain-containing protein, partial [Bacteroidia bacterium]|nr:PAS domain-containing protein [Bacteroidia bacterium]